MSGAVEYLAAAAAGLAALAYLAQQARKAWRWARNVARVLHAVHELVERELTNNHGSSMKDDLDGLATGFGAMSRLLDDVDERLTTHLSDRSTP